MKTRLLEIEYFVSHHYVDPVSSNLLCKIKLIIYVRFKIGKNRLLRRRRS